MKLEMQRQMRLEQRMVLAPRMIQSMEILQLPILALQERLEQELNDNPVLEMEEPSMSEAESPGSSDEEGSDEELNEKEMDNNKSEDFQRLASLGESYKEFMNESGSFRRRVRSDEPDPKLQAIKNTAALPQSLHEYLMEQWHLVDAEEPVKKAGKAIIDYIDDRGYLSVRLEQLHNKEDKGYCFEDLQKSLGLVQKLEPAGVGARNLKECLLIQMSQIEEDMSFEQNLVSEYMNELLANCLPDIAKKLQCDIGQINRAIERMSKLDTSPGLQIGRNQNHPISADVVVEESDGEYVVRLADNSLPSLTVSKYYEKVSKSKETNPKTKKFLKEKLQSAKWIIEAIEQRKRTLLNVSRAIVKFQKGFFDNGKLHLKPLPMSKVADEVGVHLATVSRAVAGKYVQCHRGILPLRKFFSGGTEDANGQARSWEAIRAKLQQIIDNEDKRKPLSDDQIRQELSKSGINHIARRTVAKYRNLLNIPAGRYRKKY